ncbi:MAG: type II toxin-antitoxin system VapC family toxin [Oscillospiraceae bacterium]|nr:type II toxin-antitoxin system VapC family toxin [Oscillospiraceae bacterium]
MSGIDYVADTNALIYLLSENRCMKPYLSSRLAVSIITEMELLSFHGITDAETKIIKGYLNECLIYQIDRVVKETAIIIRKKYRCKLPDAIIAATAISHGLPLLSADRGFSKIEELRVSVLTP